mmetsp:Transcript_36599/g.103211  ORF Transcript_36599/g.103211 Transcript_36599/m.103211 type:complete len:274 (+) Transcript_36599:98-919(+)
MIVKRSCHMVTTDDSSAVIGTELDQLGHEAGPTRLMRSPDAAAGVPVEVLIEEEVVPEVARGELVVHLHGRPAPVLAALEQAHETVAQRVGDLEDRHLVARAGRVLDEKPVPVVRGELLQGLDDQVVDGEPDGAAPIRVAAHDDHRRLRRVVAELAAGAVELEDVGVLEVVARQAAHAEIRQEFLGVEHALQQGPQAVPRQHRQQPPLAGAGLRTPRDQLREVRVSTAEALQPRGEGRELLEHGRLDDLHREEGDDPDERPEPDGFPLAVRRC